MSECHICKTIERIKQKERILEVVASTNTGYIVVGQGQGGRWHAEFLCSKCIPDLSCLTGPHRLNYLFHMALVMDAVNQAFQPKSLAIEFPSTEQTHLYTRFVPLETGSSSDGWVIQKVISNDVPTSAQDRDAERAKLSAALKGVFGRERLLVECYI